MARTIQATYYTIDFYDSDGCFIRYESGVSKERLKEYRAYCKRVGDIIKITDKQTHIERI